ncbi:MAG: GNAT family N-acetyltransferase [bacterium]|nr:GNAT family N-acetyltransferase [bacterium]
MRFVAVGKKNRETFDNLFNLYLHDLSEYSTWVGERQGDDGIYLKGITDKYFDDETIVYLIYYHEHLAGFICLSWGSKAEHKADYMIQEFFILRPFRKTGFAKRTVREIFKKYPGKYSLHVLKENIPAHRFWRRKITEAGASFKFYWYDEEQDTYLFEIKKRIQ